MGRIEKKRLVKLVAESIVQSKHEMIEFVNVDEERN